MTITQYKASKSSPPAEFVPDEWLKVAAATADDARRFFGTPKDWPVQFDRFDERGRRVWKVKAEGLEL